MLAKFSGLNPKGPYVSLEKEKQNFCVVPTYSINRAREIRKFHVAVVQRRQGNVQKKGDARAKMFFFAVRHRRCKNSLLLSSRNFRTMVTRRHTSPLFNGS